MTTTEEVNKANQQKCHICSRFTIETRRRFGCPLDAKADGYVYDEVMDVRRQKVAICEKCFTRLYPSKKRKRTLFFWAMIFPIVGEQKVG